MLPLARHLPANLARLGVEPQHELRSVDPLPFQFVEERPREAVTHHHQNIFDQLGGRARTMMVVVGNHPAPQHLPLVIQAGGAKRSEVHIDPVGGDNGSGRRLPRLGQSFRSRIDGEQLGAQKSQLACLRIETDRPQRTPCLSGGGQPDRIPPHHRRRPPFPRDRHLPDDIFALRPGDGGVGPIRLTHPPRTPELIPGWGQVIGGGGQRGPNQTPTGSQQVPQPIATVDSHRLSPVRGGPRPAGDPSPRTAASAQATPLAPPESEEAQSLGRAGE